MFSDLKELETALSLTPENADFFHSSNGLLMAKIPEANYEGRVHLARAFPFEKTEEYISVQNVDKEEIGMIRVLSDFDERSADILREELEKKYFSPKIKKIVKLSSRFGMSYWDCETDQGPLSFTVNDTNRSLLRAGEDRVFVLDHDGCRYEIPSLAALDKKSLGKIEMYL